LAPFTGHAIEKCAARAALFVCVSVFVACKTFDQSSSSIKADASPSEAPSAATVYAVLGQAPPNPPQITLARRGSIVPTKNWPDACELLTKDDIQAILPGATEIREERHVVNTRTIEEFAANAPNFNDESKFGGSCLYLFQLPSEPHARSRVWVRILAVADPALIESYYKKVLYASPMGPEHCGVTGMFEGNLRCYAGPLIFEAGGYGTARFKETEVFGVAPPFFWRDKILPEFVKSIAAKLSHSK
jgi:hypothetical protein